MSFAVARGARTGGVGDPEINDLVRRLSNVLRFGRVHSADYPGARVRVEMGAASDPDDYIVTAWLPWFAGRAGRDREWWAPEIGEAVMVLSPGGELANGVVLPGVFSTSAPAPADAATVHRVVYEDGAVVEYDKAAHKLTATIPGDVDVAAEGDVAIQAQGSAAVQAAGAVDVTSGVMVTITAPAISMSAAGGSAEATLVGNFALQGTLTVEGDISASGTIMDGGGNSNHHTH